MRFARALATAVLLAGVHVCSGAETAGSAPFLTLQGTIPLERVTGRIDHLAADLEHRRVFIAELGNGSVDVIDVEKRASLHRIAELDEPQGIAYSERTGTLYVATGGDGVLHSYSGATLSSGKSTRVGTDADNVRIDESTGRVYVGFDGGIAVLNAASLELLGEVLLRAHPESFQLQASQHRMFVNVPEAGEIAVIDLVSLKQTDTWKTGGHSSNFPMALDAVRKNVLVAFRHPSELGIYEMDVGKLLKTSELCSDSDDLYVDEKRAVLFASCGAGFLDTYDLGDDVRIDRVFTRPGARTSLYVPEWNQLLVAARATTQEPATVLIYKLGGALRQSDRGNQ